MEQYAIDHTSRNTSVKRKSLIKLKWTVVMHVNVFFFIKYTYR